MLPSPDCPGEGGLAPQSSASNGFLWRQLSATGLAAIAEKVAAGRDLDLDEALSLSRVSLPLLAKMVQLRPVASDNVLITLRRDVSNVPPTSSGAGDTPAAAALPIDRVASLRELRPGIGQGLADWESFCRTLITIRSEVSLNGNANFWYPIVEQPLDRDLACAGNITGAEVLRAISLARLVLPAAMEVRAPLATLGPKVAQVALDFGATHLGYVAPDGQTPDDPLIADPSMLDELLESCSPTCLKQ